MRRMEQTVPASVTLRTDILRLPTRIAIESHTYTREQQVSTRHQTKTEAHTRRGDKREDSEFAFD